MLERGPGGPWPSQNFGWVGHNAFRPTNNWPVCSLIPHCSQLILRKIRVSLQCPRLLPLFKGPTSKGMEGNGRGEEKVNGKEGERWREGFGPPKNFRVAPPMAMRTMVNIKCQICMMGYERRNARALIQTLLQ